MKINKVIDFFKERPVKAILLCYICVIALVVGYHIVLGLGVFAAHLVGYYDERHLNVDDFQQVGVERIDQMNIINATDDTQLIYTGGAHNLYVKCNFSYEPGEFVLFYSSNEDDGFGTNKMLHAKEIDDYYVFQMPFTTKSFRLDTGVSPSITVNFDEIILNKAGVFDIVRLSTGTLFWLFILPPIIFSIISVLIEIYSKINKKQAP